nr:chaperone protein clpc1, chloroplastic [Quercus suber]
MLGLIGEGIGIAGKVLKSIGINLKDAHVEVEKIIGRGSGFVAVEIPFTPRAKRVLELSLEEENVTRKKREAATRGVHGSVGAVFSQIYHRTDKDWLPIIITIAHYQG